MASNPTAAPILFDRALMRRRQRRALQQGSATFLLDRVADELAERLHAVLPTFPAAADVGTPGDQLRRALAGRVGALTPVDVPDRENEGLSLAPQSLDLVVS